MLKALPLNPCLVPAFAYPTLNNKVVIIVNKSFLNTPFKNYYFMNFYLMFVQINIYFKVDPWIKAQ